MNGHGVALHDDWLRVFFPTGGHGDFHYRWLRHNCSRDLHPTTRERTLCSSEISDSLRAKNSALFRQIQTIVTRTRENGDPSQMAGTVALMLQEASSNSDRALQEAEKLLRPEQWTQLPLGITARQDGSGSPVR